MANSAYKPFGLITASATESGNLSATSSSNFFKRKRAKNKRTNNNQEDMKAILQSAVGDFTERPLQIMIREIAKNLLIFTPIGWIVLLVIIGRKYKGRLSTGYTNIKDAFIDAINSLGLQKLME